MLGRLRLLLLSTGIFCLIFFTIYSFRNFTPQTVFINLFQLNQTFQIKSNQALIHNGSHLLPGGITMIVHYVYRHLMLPEQYIPMINNCMSLNPEFKFVLWTDDDFQVFLKKEFSEKYNLLYKNYTVNIQKGDVQRLFLVYHFGGIYMDLDVECIKPFRIAQLNNYSALLDQERHYQSRLHWNYEFLAMNSVMMFRPKHPFANYTIEKLFDSLKQGHTLWRTGPMFLTECYKSYSVKVPADQVYLASPYWFSPLLNPRAVGYLRSKCYNPRTHWEKVACEEWAKTGYNPGNVTELTNNAILVHKFLNLGYDWAQHQIKKRINITETIPKLIYYRNL